MDIIQQIIDFIMGLLGQSTSEPKKLDASPKEAEAPKKVSAEGDLKGLDELEGAENVRVASGEVKEERDGASMIEDEDDGTLLWVSTVNMEVPRESWDDVWGPLDGPDDDSLAAFFGHELAFNMEMQSDAHDAEEKIKELGYEDAGEFFKVRATILKHFGTHDGPNLDDCVLDSQQVMSASMKGHQQYHRGNQAAAAEANPELLAPVDGITLEQWAQISANAIGKEGEEWQALLASHGLDQARWEEVSGEWNNRMANDDSHTITTKYAEAFQGAGAGQFGAAGQAHAATGYDGTAAAGEEPMPLERCCEIQGAMQAWSKTGQDVNAMLAQTFEMNAAEFSAAHSWWLSQLTADVARFGEYNALCEKYEAQYSAAAPAAPDDDLAF